MYYHTMRLRGRLSIRDHVPRQTLEFLITHGTLEQYLMKWVDILDTHIITDCSSIVDQDLAMRLVSRTIDRPITPAAAPRQVNQPRAAAAPRRSRQPRPAAAPRMLNQPRPAAAPRQVNHIQDIPCTKNGCVICLENEAIMAIVPCGHTAFCNGCITKCTQCPICRAPIQGVLRIYLN
jgi:Zinc finger, C3HC4 type (RING finger)